MIGQSLRHLTAAVAVGAIVVSGCGLASTSIQTAGPTPTEFVPATPYATLPETYVCDLIGEPNVTRITGYPIPFTYQENDPMGTGCYWFYEAPPDHLVTSVGIVIQDMNPEDYDIDIAARKDDAERNGGRQNEMLSGVGDKAWWDGGKNFDASGLYVLLGPKQVVIGVRDMQEHYDYAQRKATALALFDFVRSKLQ